MVLSFNPLVLGMEHVHSRIARFKERARSFYFEVLLCTHPCPDCGARLVMSGASRALCEGCRKELDPTEAFQKSPCCGARLRLHRTHYACATCGAVVPSLFLFDESVFDATYFREAMRVSRERVREQRERVRLMLLGTRSDALSVTALPGLDEVPGLMEALAAFVQEAARSSEEFYGGDVFDMPAYRRVILEAVCSCSVLFDAIPTLGQDLRKDRARRFVTLLYMEQEREVVLTQYGEKIVVEKYEAAT